MASVQGMLAAFKARDRDGVAAEIAALIRHWSAVLGDKLLTVSYEALVADPDAWIPRILKHCGLEDEPGVRDFNKSSRPVLTASVAQVREPISTAAVAKWKR